MIIIKKRYKILVSLLVALLVVFSCGYYKQTQNVINSEKQIQEITKQLSDTSEMLFQKESEIKEYISQISELENEISYLRSNVISKNPGSRGDVIRNADGSWTATFTIYGYDACMSCCGKTDGITATGTVATPGRTIAVDPKLIPLGSQVIFNGNTYIAEDTGGAIRGNKIDLFFKTHQEALNWGVRTMEITVLPKGE